MTDDNQTEPVGETEPDKEAERVEEGSAPAAEVAPDSTGEAPLQAPINTLRQAYAEAGMLYRQFSGRRGRLFAGYLTVVAVIVVAFAWAWTNPDAKPMAWIVMAAGCLLTFVFWALERRTRHVSFACIQAASRLEQSLGLRLDQGVFTSLKRLPAVEPAPGKTFDWMYLVAALALLVGTVYALAETT